MSNANFPRFVLLLMAFAIIGTLQAQDASKEAVILINTQPVLAEISEGGNVNNIISEQPDFLNGFTLKIQDYGQFLATNQTETAHSQGYKVESTKMNVIRFDDDFATLTDEGIMSLDDVISQMNTNSAVSIVVRSVNFDTKSPIVKNRLNSIRTYLNLKNISIDRVKFESLVGNEDINEIKVFLYQ